MKKIANIILLLAILVFVAACFRKEKARLSGRQAEKPENIIPPEKMTELFTELYLTDGLLNNPTIRDHYNERDSNLNYLDIIDSHGLTKPQVDDNIEYYFINKPKKFEAIFDKVLANLSAMQAENMQKKEVRDRANANLWEGKASYNMPDDGINYPVDFKIPLRGPGEYILKSRVVAYGDDQTIEPRATIFFWKTDSTENGIREYWDTHFYEKNGKSEMVTMSRHLSDTSFTHLSGWLYNYTSQPGHWEMHSRISSIILTLKQDESEEELIIH